MASVFCGMTAADVSSSLAALALYDDKFNSKISVSCLIVHGWASSDLSVHSIFKSTQLVRSRCYQTI
jgi:hypothetical protein